MNKAVEFIGQRGIYYLGTVWEGRPRLRPFGFCYGYQGKMIIPTEKKKKVYEEMSVHSQVEICKSYEDDRWIRVTGHAKELDDRKIYDAFFRDVPLMKEFFNKEDPDFVLFEISGEALFFHNETFQEKIEF